MYFLCVWLNPIVCLNVFFVSFSFCHTSIHIRQLFSNILMLAFGVKNLLTTSPANQFSLLTCPPGHPHSYTFPQKLNGILLHWIFNTTFNILLCNQPSSSFSLNRFQGHDYHYMNFSSAFNFLPFWSAHFGTYRQLYYHCPILHTCLLFIPFLQSIYCTIPGGSTEMHIMPNLFLISCLSLKKDQQQQEASDYFTEPTLIIFHTTSP